MIRVASVREHYDLLPTQAVKGDDELVAGLDG